jgi:hypothetical protein
MANRQMPTGVAPFTTVEAALCEAFHGTGMRLPSRAVDPATPSLSLVDLDLDLGRVRADVTLWLAHALRQKEPAA